MNELDAILKEAIALTEEHEGRLKRWKSPGKDVKDIYCLVDPGHNGVFYVGASGAIGQQISAHRKYFGRQVSQLRIALLEIEPDDWRVAKLKWSKRLTELGCQLVNQDARSLSRAESSDRAGVQISRHHYNQLTDEAIKQSKPRGVILDELLEQYFSDQLSENTALS